MDIKCHFEFSDLLGDPEKYCSLYGREDNMVFILFYEIFKLLREKNKEINIKASNSWHDCNEIAKKPIYDKTFFTIENVKNGKYMLISILDKIAPAREIIFSPDCVEFFPFVGIHNNDIYYHQIPNLKYTPISTSPTSLAHYKRIEELYKKNLQNDERIIPDKIYFRSKKWGVREILSESSDKICLEKERLYGHEFIDELNKYKINFDINSVAEISTRTSEIMGLGGVLVRPSLTIQYHNRLIPDYHYAATRGDFIYTWENAKQIVDSYLDRLNDLKKDPDLVEFISKNGRKWYEENCTIENCTKIIVDRIDLNKLI